ncbi:MAG TPA: hypothetical protein VEV41_12890, partial [Terriglobales bacterium]|nr:hypothetical protein [Terriglobales bacterium]
EPICAHSLAVKLKRRVHITVPEQTLNNLQVCADTHEEEGQQVLRLCKPNLRGSSGERIPTLTAEPGPQLISLAPELVLRESMGSVRPSPPE